MNSKHIIHTHQGMKLEYSETGNGLQQVSFNVAGAPAAVGGLVSAPNFQLAAAGWAQGFHPDAVTGNMNLPQNMRMVDAQITDDGIAFKYHHDDSGLSVTARMVFVPGAAVIRQVTSVANEGSEPVTLTHLSSLYMPGIATDGYRPWHDKKKMRVHYCRQSWEGEGQWRSGDLEELGLYPTSVHPCASAVHLSSRGSFSTSRLFPLAVVEDMETGKVWYVQVESSTNWHIEIGHRCPWDEWNKGSLFIQADCCDELHGGWVKELMPGESFAAPPAAIGCCAGDFTDAVRELTKYRRSVLKPENPWKEFCPVVFNDFMNCLWGDPTCEKLIPLINAATEAGAECFCIDAGWFDKKTDSWGVNLGDWEPSADRFGEKGLQGILDYIKAKGMIPGLWLEMESCSEASRIFNKPDSWFLMRNGKRVGGIGNGRWHLNFANGEVREYMHSVIDRLTGMGVGYLKNDYNSSAEAGDDVLGESAADGLIKCTDAFYNFIDEVRRKHPDLIIENCGSGAMRQDNGIMTHFHLQSFSDQEIYYKCPSIIAGGLAGVLPEQYAIWAYPYPLLFSDRLHPDILQSEAYIKSMADGEQTVFNMVNGLCGNLYLSGHIDYADSLNWKLVQEGVELYKSERGHIQNAFPVWPIGFTRINDRDAWACVGLMSFDGKRLLLAVWRLGGEEYMDFPIRGWAGKNAVAKQLFPAVGFDVKYCYNINTGSLTVHMPDAYTARYFELTSVV